MSSATAEIARVRRADTDLPINVGDTVDHFTIKRELGRGGMGVVFLAHDNSLDRDVALKVIIAKQSDARERFFREARAQAKLTSPHVVPIHYIGTAPQMAMYFAMEYVQGESLEAILDRAEKLDPERARVLMLEIAGALREAHAAGFIHRDIKPSNLLVDRSGHVKIADFGLAKPLPGSGVRSLTDDGVVLGTPMYMPPEQIQSTEIDHRTDMYALGASFWHLVAGEPPYDAESSVSIFVKHINEPVPSLRAVAPNVPAPLAAVIERLLQKERSDRYLTYDALIAALEAAAPSFGEPAGLTIRGAASVIDLGIGAVLLAFVPLSAPIYVLVLIALHAWRGQTLGKYLVRIRAERADGSRLGELRSACRFVAAAWLPLYWATVILVTQGHHDFFGGIRSGVLTAFVLQHVMFSLLYAGSLGLAAIHPNKRALHDLMVGSRVVHVRAR